MPIDDRMETDPDNWIVTLPGKPLPRPDADIVLSDGTVVSESWFGRPPANLSIAELTKWYTDREKELVGDINDISDLNSYDRLFNIQDKNPYHEPAGSPKGGRFARKPGSVDIKQDLSKDPTASPTQSVSDLDELYAKARADEPVFKKELEEIAELTGGKAHFTPPEFAEPGTTLKSRKSAERKIRDELEGDASKLVDVMRGTVLYNTVGGSRVGLAEYIKQQGNNIVRIKDRQENPLSGGYRDVLVNVRSPSGLIAEVQFNSKHMLGVKMGTGHELYEKSRQAGLTQDMREYFLNQGKQAYEEAYHKDGNGNYKRAR